MDTDFPIKISDNKSNSLRDHFLIAMPSLTDSMFTHSVTYLCDHNEHGAMGIIINQPMEITLDEVFEQLSLDQTPESSRAPVLAGGPVNVQRGFVLHRHDSNWQSTLHVTDEISLTASKDIMDALSKGKGPDKAQFALGYAGWGPGQLEEEISENSWLTIPADTGTMFDIPVEERWAAASKRIGVDLNLISTTAGHA